MSRTISPVSGKSYGLARVCRIWRVPRATVYRYRAPPPGAAPQRPGPVGPMADVALLEQIRAVLARQPFSWGRSSQGLGPAADRRDPHLAAARAASDA